MVIAWRNNCLMRLRRTLPEPPADVVFKPDEWRAVFILDKKPISKQMPTRNTAVHLIAQRGSFLGRKGDGGPTAKTIWLGCKRPPSSSKERTTRVNSEWPEFCVMGWD